MGCNALIFNCVEFKYITHQDRDCLWGNNIRSMTSNNNFDDCNKWCANNIYCGGYINSGNRCHFKDKSCKSNLFHSNHKTAYIPQGNFKPDTIKMYTIKYVFYLSYVLRLSIKTAFIPHGSFTPYSNLSYLFMLSI